MEAYEWCAARSLCPMTEGCQDAAPFIQLFMYGPVRIYVHVMLVISLKGNVCMCMYVCMYVRTYVRIK
jgi:hypothetical protein